MRRFLLFSIFLFTISLPTYADILASVIMTKKLRVCIWPEYYGISYIEPRTQTLLGIDVDLAKELAQDLHVDITFIESSFSKLIADITQKRCDIAMFAIGRTPERLEYLHITTPHLASDIYAITTKSNKRIQTWEDIDQEGVIVAVAKGTLHVSIMQERLLHAKLLIVDSLHAREQEVEAGRADVFMTDYPFGMRMMAEREWAKLIKPSLPFHITPYGWALDKRESAWQERVEAFIQTIQKDGRLFEAAKKHHLEPIIMREKGL